MATPGLAAKARVLAADRARRDLETELEVLLSQLGPAGMTGPLVDGACAGGGGVPAGHATAGGMVGPPTSCGAPVAASRAVAGCRGQRCHLVPCNLWGAPPPPRPPPPPIAPRRPAADGYPRGDVDVMAVRTLRQQVIMRRNDLAARNAELAGALEALHALGPDALPPAPAAAAANRPAGTVPARGPAPPDTAGLAPFALVDDVSAGSPAAAAGLARGDRLLVFGAVRGVPQGGLSAGPSLADVAAAVRAAEGQPLALVVRRAAAAAADNDDRDGGSRAAAGSSSTVDVALSLTPARWAGQGLLGCHVVPL
jgi:26S proteasome regulatory subunit N4